MFVGSTASVPWNPLESSAELSSQCHQRRSKSEMTVGPLSSGGEALVDDASKGDVLDKEVYDSKYERIMSAVGLRDVLALKCAAAEPGGLLENFLRKKCWPILLNVDSDSPLGAPSQDEVKNHRYYQQVLMDVARSIKRFPPSIPSEQRIDLQDKLINVIMRVLIANADLHYYQGYHDICVTVLLVVDGDEDLAFRLINEISRTRLRVYMEETMQATQQQLQIAYSIFEARDPKLRRFLEKAECGVMFCLSWCLTWFGHDLENYSELLRLYDLFLANDEKNYLLPVYVSAALVLSRSERIQEEECSLPSVHSYLMNLLNDMDDRGLDLENCIFEAKKLHAEYPAERLEEIETEKRRRDEELKRWQRSIVGMTIIRLSRTNWKSGSFVGAVLVLSVAVGYQMYKRSISSISQS